jgi:Ca-activated chloride channel family protein
MSDFFTHFHFLHPAWLLGLLPLGLLWWALWRQRSGKGSAWQKLVDPQLLPYLLVQEGAGSKPRLLLYLLASGWLLGVLALADPVWQQRPQPVYQQADAQVVVLDLSPTMLAQDASPNRLTQARFKVEDLLRNSPDKQTGLVVYAGDAFSVTPLTTDMATLQSQLRVLEPNLMPVSGNRPDLGLQQAGELLKQAGLQHGHIILLADEAGDNDTAATARKLVQQGYQVSVLGIGTAAGAPVPGLRDSQGKPLMSRVDSNALQAIAKAGDGQFATYSSGLQDVHSILAADRQGSQTQTAAVQDKVASRWVENGPWLAVLLLPLAALAFRRGWLLTLAFVAVGQFASPQPAMASTWNDLWQRPDQQAASALNAKDYAKAAAIAPDAAQRGAAEYLAGDYAHSIQSFQQQSGPNADYNLGNALAQAGKYQDAIKAYDQSLKTQPGMADAVHNRKLVEDLLKKQQQQQDQQQQANQGQQQNPDQQGKDQQQANAKPAAEKPEFNQAGDKQQQQQAQQAVSAAAQTAQQQQAQEKDTKPAQQAAGETDNLSPEQRQSVENWLRRVPDDPGGLLRRKFLYQYQQRQQAAQPQT